MFVKPPDCTTCSPPHDIIPVSLLRTGDKIFVDEFGFAIVAPGNRYPYAPHSDVESRVTVILGADTQGDEIMLTYDRSVARDDGLGIRSDAYVATPLRPRS